MRILVLYWDNDPKQFRLTIRQHLYALQVYTEKHQILYWNACLGTPAWLRMMPCIDVVILHTTLLCMRWGEAAEFRELRERMAWLSTLDAAKIAIPQDEYDHAELLDEWLYNLGVSVIFSNFGEEARKLLYPLSLEKAGFQHCFTGYIDRKTADAIRSRLRPLRDRSVDLIYRARRLPYWFGHHGQIKHRISDVVGEAARRRGLVVDVSTREADTVLGEQWLDFLSSGRVVLGCESGSSVLDARGMIRKEIQRTLQANPTLTFEEMSRRMPAGWDSHGFFAISPRHFEAVMTKTGQVLVEGRYNGVLQAWRHYIPLKEDFSNIDPVLDVIKDTDFLQDMVNRTYAEIIECGQYTYKRFAEMIEEAAECVLAKGTHPVRRGRRICLSVAWSSAKQFARCQESVHPIAQAVQMFLGRIRTPAEWFRVVVRSLVAVCQVWSARPLRRIVLQTLSKRSLRRSVRIGCLLRDLWRLVLLRNAVSGPGKGDESSALWVEVQFKPGDQSLLLRSRLQSVDRVRNAGDLEVLCAKQLTGSLKRIAWDHSGIADSISCPILRSQVMVPMGPNGVYEFHSLARLAECSPESIWECLNWSLVCNT